MSKKTWERAHLDGFLEALSLPHGIPEEGEAPDFIVTLGHRRVGVEVVQVFADQDAGNSKRREDESHRRTWLGRLCEEYYRRGGPPVRLQLQVAPEYYERTRGRIPIELRERLLDRLLARAPRVKEGAPLKSRIRGKHQGMLATMWIRRLPDTFERYCRWQILNDMMAWVPRLSREYLDDIIAKKAGKLAAYKERVPDVVLLMVADGSLASGLVQYDDGPVDGRGFEAVYLLRYPKGEVRELVAPTQAWVRG